MEPKQVLIAAAILVAVVILFPIVYTNWPRDPNPPVDVPILAEFHRAIVQYYKDYGELPEDLDDLTPKYFQEIPLASNRKPFVYDPNTGKVTPPYPLTPERVEFFKDLKLPIATGSPMGEVMTGIGVRNELNY